MKHAWIFLLILSFSCKKDKNESPAPLKTEHVVLKQRLLDTIKPFPYLPAFPGSWWRYVSDNGAIITNTTEPAYVKDFYAYFSSSDSKIHSSDTFYVPVYMGRRIWGQLEHKDTHWPYGPPVELIPIVSDSLNVGASWATYHENSHSHYYSRIISKDTSIVIAGRTYSPTIVLELSTGGDFPPYHRYSLEYYTKDIGLVKTEGVSNMSIIAFVINW